MNRGIIISRYAKAFFAYAKEKKQEQSIYEQCRLLVHQYRQYPALWRVMINPLLLAEKKEEIIRTALEGTATHEFMRFIGLVIEQRREEFLAEMCLDYKELYRDYRKLLEADLTTAVAVNDDTKKRIREKLEQITGYSIELKTLVNPNIIGGYVVRLDDYRLDASVATKLKRIEEQLLTATISG